MGLDARIGQGICLQEVAGKLKCDEVTMSDTYRNHHIIALPVCPLLILTAGTRNNRADTKKI